MAFQTMILLLQSRLSDTIREELGATYSITATGDTVKVPVPEYRVRIEWTCDPTQTQAVVARVMREVEFVRQTLLSPEQIGRVRDVLRREFDRNSQDNSYWLNQVVRRYSDGDAANVDAITEVPQRIAALDGYAVQLAAQRYLDPTRYVRVTLMPESSK
jgi:zinc protease